MKTMRFLLVAVLLAASTTLFAKTNANSFEKTKTNHQTERLVKQLDLSKDQANEIKTINTFYYKRVSLLYAQRNVLETLGYMNEAIQIEFLQTLSNYDDTRKQEIESVLNK